MFGFGRKKKDVAPEVRTEALTGDGPGSELTAVNAARGAMWSSVGTVDPYVVSHLINPAFMGGAQWPGLRQAFRKITRADGLPIVASDGLADPDLDDPAAGPGLGAEVYLCSTAFADTPMGDLSSLWQFETVYQVAQNIASMPVELGPQLDRYGALSLSLPGSSAPAEWLDEEGTLGVLIGVPLEGVPVSVPVPNGAVRFVGVIPLRPNELAYILAEGADARRDVATRLTELPASAAASADRPSVIGPVASNTSAEIAPDSGLVTLPAAQLWQVVARVLEDTSPFAPEAELVAGEILRLRDTGQLSKALASDLSSLIYQRGMHAGHTGDFQLTDPIRQLKDEIGHHKQAGFPDLQADPVQVQARIAGIADGIPLPSREPEVVQDQAGLLASIARAVASGVAPGWQSLRFEVWSIGDVMSYELFTSRDGEEDRSLPGIAIYEPLNLLKTACYAPESGTWLSLTMHITSSGELAVDYNFDSRPELDIDVSTDDYELELRLFPRPTSSVPAWWQERTAQTNALKHAGVTSPSAREPAVEKGRDSVTPMKITYEQPNTPRHTVDLSVTGIRVDGVLIDLLGGPEQLVPVLGEPRIKDGLGTAYTAWDDAGIGASTFGGELSNIDVADSIITPEEILPTSAGETKVTVEGRDVLELDWDATPPMDKWTKSINVGAFRVERCETPGCYSFWTFTVAL